MLRFFDDLAGSIYDVLMSISYFFAGIIIIAAPMYLIAWVFGLFN